MPREVVGVVRNKTLTDQTLLLLLLLLLLLQLLLLLLLLLLLSEVRGGRGPQEEVGCRRGLLTRSGKGVGSRAVAVTTSAVGDIAISIRHTRGEGSTEAPMARPRAAAALTEIVGGRFPVRVEQPRGGI